jgi:PAS domain S-box-containing protein
MTEREREVPAGAADEAVTRGEQGDSTVALADLADLAYFEVDGERNVVAMSPALERLTGFRAEDMVGQSCLEVIRCTECLRGCGVFEYGDVRGARITMFRSDGTEVEVRKSGRVFRDADGDITGALEVVHPLEPEELAGEGSPGELDVLLGSLGRDFMVADEDLAVTRSSASLPALLGLPADGLRGLPLERLFGAELFGEEGSLREAVRQGERREGMRAFLRTAAGASVPVSFSIGPLESADACAGLEGRVVLMIRPEETDSAAVPSFSGIVARSPAMQRIFRVVELLRHNDSTVLITGESGTGKELVARALHDNSHRSEGPFVAVNCAAIPSELLESELFGHARGAFTGAVRDRAGRFELADGGTLFLDEIGDLALNLQAKLLRFLQERTFERVGESKTREVDTRIIAATNANLVQAVSERRFREDLYYRLRVVPIDIPPLRKRREDLELLIRYFLERIGRERGRALRLAPSASRALLAYPWPGNVRELENALEYATTVCEGQTIHVRDLPLEIGREADGTTAAPNYPGADAEWQDLAFAESDGSDREGSGPGGGRAPEVSLTPAQAAEAAQLRRALEAARYRREEAARLLGISRTTLWRKMKQYDL